MPRRCIEIHFDPFSGNWDCHQWIDRPNWLLYWLFGGWAIWVDSGFDKQTFLLYGCLCVCVNDTGAISFYHLTLWVWHSLQCLGEIIWILNKFRISAWIFCMCACVSTVFVEFHQINWRLWHTTHSECYTHSNAQVRLGDDSEGQLVGKHLCFLKHIILMLMRCSYVIILNVESEG